MATPEPWDDPLITSIAQVMLCITPWDYQGSFTDLINYTFDAR